MSLAVKDFPDHHDAELVLKLYDLRREQVMRDSRAAVFQQLHPKSAQELIDAVKTGGPLNPAFRQVSTYWEMAYGMIKHGVLHADFMLECNGGEGIAVFARVAPFLDEYRRALGAHRLVNTEWVVKNTDAGRRTFELYSAQVAKTLGTK